MISPSNIFVIFLVICKPKPIPFVFSYFVDSRKPNSWKSFGMSSVFIPMPVSSTYISRKVLFGFSRTASSRAGSSIERSDGWQTFFAVIVIRPPLGVNLIALDSKFNRTC